MEKKIEPERERHNFDEMVFDQLLGWWLFRVMDDTHLDTPLQVIQAIEEFRRFKRETMIRILDDDYN